MITYIYMYNTPCRERTFSDKLYNLEKGRKVDGTGVLIEGLVKVSSKERILRTNRQRRVDEMLVNETYGARGMFMGKVYTTLRTRIVEFTYAII